MNGPPALKAQLTGEKYEFAASGRWTAVHAEDVEAMLAEAALKSQSAPNVLIDMRDVGAFDTFGAWLVERLIRTRSSAGHQTVVAGLSEEFQTLLDNVHGLNREDGGKKRAAGIFSWFQNASDALVAGAGNLLPFLDMVGALGAAVVRVISRPKDFRLTSTVHQLDRVGWQAAPIVLLITFLIGCIIAQQGFFHFRKFGAESYVVDMVGILILREIGVLLVAIMVAGRSGSSYTAELGSMKMREEIDALKTMGLDPVEVLILPRVLALLIAVPILTFLGSIAALYGGGLVAWLYAGMNPDIFVARLHEAITTTHFKVGMLKAPFMALVIGIVACSEGLQVKGSSESLGLKTTTSVVKSIFLVILLDGLFAIFFAAIGM